MKKNKSKSFKRKNKSKSFKRKNKSKSFKRKNKSIRLKGGSTIDELVALKLRVDKLLSSFSVMELFISELIRLQKEVVKWKLNSKLARENNTEMQKFRFWEILFSGSFFFPNSNWDAACDDWIYIEENFDTPAGIKLGKKWPGLTRAYFPFDKSAAGNYYLSSDLFEKLLNNLILEEYFLDLSEESNFIQENVSKPLRIKSASCEMPAASDSIGSAAMDVEENDAPRNKYNLSCFCQLIRRYGRSKNAKEIETAAINLLNKYYPNVESWTKCKCTRRCTCRGPWGPGPR